MKPVSFACLLAAAFALGALRLTAAEGARLRYLASAYSDDKGGGLSLPEGVGCGAKGQLLVADTGNGRLLRFTFQDKGFSGGTEIKVPQLPAPVRVQLNSKGEIYALDGRLRRLVQFGPDGGLNAAFAFDGVPPPATIVAKAFAIDQADQLYVLDVFSGRVLVLDARGRFQRAVAVPGDVGFVSDLTVDASGTVYLLDSIKRRLLSAGKDARSFSPLGGDLSESLVTLPASMTTSRGLIFVVEGGGSAVVTFGRDGAFLSRQLTMGWDEGTLNHPAQMCVNDKDEVFIADRDNSRIQAFQLMR
jgi:hypothetical protein